MSLVFSPVCNAACFLSHDSTHNLWGNESNLTGNYYDKIAEFKLCLTLYTQMVGGNLWKLGPVEMSTYFHLWTLLPDAQSAELSEREGEGASYEASCSVCSTFSGLYSSAVTQSVIFKRSIYWEQARLCSTECSDISTKFYCWTGTTINWEKSNKTALTCLV